MAVYTEVDDDDLIAFCGQYDLGDVLACKGIAEGVENTNYLLTLSSGPYILTLYEKRVNPADLPFFLGLMEHLAAAGVPCPQPIAARDGIALRQLAGRPCVIISFLAGMSPKKPQALHCAELGRALAEFHLGTADFAGVRANSLSVGAWRGLLESCGQDANRLRPGFYDELANELTELEADWPTDLPSGVIHADLFPDNVFFRGRYLSGLIDFYFACNDSYAYDVGICLNAWCFEPDNSFNITKAQHLLSAYRQVRDFSEPELMALPVLARGAAMRFLLTRLYDWIHTPEQALVVRKDPMEYWDKLRFHKAVSSPGEYGLGF
ncbi:MAG: homoserine kinase [Rhodospirillales bacterium]|nr:homoserine kinase [Rhodospirillales bacterium]